MQPTYWKSALNVNIYVTLQWLQTLLSGTGIKLKAAGSSKHAYALEYPEPLVHFALCLGAYSDPAVRLDVLQPQIFYFSSLISPKRRC